MPLPAGVFRLEASSILLHGTEWEETSQNYRICGTAKWLNFLGFCYIAHLLLYCGRYCEKLKNGLHLVVAGEA